MGEITGKEDGGYLPGTSGDDLITGLGGEDFIDGFAGADTIDGGGGNDWIAGGAGLDQLHGGSGDDTLYINAAGDIVAGEIYDGGSGDDVVAISSAGYVPTALDLTGATFSTVEGFEAYGPGGARIDVLLTVEQVLGFDRLDAIINLANGGSLALGGKSVGAVFRLSDQATTIALGGASSPYATGFEVYGGAAGDTITGGALGDFLFGDGGDDALSGGAGDDLLRGGSGLDSVSGGAGNDTLLVGSGNDIVAGETFDGGTGYDVILFDPDPDFDASGPYDLTGSILIGIEGIRQEYDVYGGVWLIPSQINGLKEIHGFIEVKGTGSVSLAGIDADNSVYRLADTVAGFSAAGMIGSFAGLYAGNNANSLVGSAGSDFIDGAGGDDTIDGMGGSDQLFGGAGNDVLSGGDGNDTLSGGDGADQLRGGAGDDTLIVDSNGAPVGEVYDGGAGYDRLDISSGGLDLSQQTISNLEWLDAGYYTAAKATVAQLLSFQTLQGSFVLADGGALNLAGKTLYDFNLETSAVGNRVDLTGASEHSANLVGMGGNDTLIGGTGHDHLTGGGGNDSLAGANGDDVLVAGAGRDTARGGAGDDTFLTFEASDILAGEVFDGGAGYDVFRTFVIDPIDLSQSTLTGFERFDMTYAATVTLTIAQFDQFSDIGSGTFKFSDAGSISLADLAASGASFVLSDFGNTLDARDFAQAQAFVTGGAGADTVYGTAQGNVLSGEGGNDTLFGGSGNDVLKGGSGTNRLVGGAGNDNYHVVSSSDVLVEQEGQGNDTVFSSVDFALAGNIENLYLASGAGNINASGNALANLINGNDGDNSISGGGGADTIHGGTGKDTIDGGDGADLLAGGIDDDEVSGGKGNDTIIGGSGTDTVVFSGNRADYFVDQFDGGYKLFDQGVPGRDGLDIVSDFERFQFADGIVLLADILLNNPVPAPNTAPQYANATKVIAAVEGAALQFAAAATDADGDALSYSSSIPAHGTVSGGAQGLFTYTPSAGYSGNDSFTVTATDGRGGSATLTITVTVSPLNIAPIAQDDALEALEDTPATIAFSSLLGNDSDVDGDTLTIAAVANASNGTVALSGSNTVLFTPAAGFVGTAGFDYTVTDGRGGTDTAHVTIAVQSTNVAPTALAATASAVEDGAVVTGQFQASDPEGDTLTFSLLAAGPSPLGIAGLTINSDGSYAFDPSHAAHQHLAAGETVELLAGYAVSDGELTTSATLTITLTGANDAPTVPASQRVSAPAGAQTSVSVAAVDVDGDPLGYVASGAAHGSVTAGAGGVFSYTPAAGYLGTDSFTVTASDGQGGSAIQTINLTVVAPLPSDWRMFASEGFTGSIGGSGTMFGTAGYQDISVTDIAGSVTFDASFNRGGDIVRLTGAASDWQIVRSGSSAVLTDGDTFVTLPVGPAGMAVVFDDGARTLRLDVGGGGAFLIGDQVFTATLARVDAAPDGTVLPGGADAQASARLFLAEDGGASAAGKVNVIGTGGAEIATLLSGTITLDPSFNKGGDVIRVDEAAEDFLASKSGSSALLVGSDTTLLVPVGLAGATLAFGDGSDTRELLLSIEPNGITIDEQFFGVDPVRLMAAAG